jgi:hypothetical protein
MRYMSQMGMANMMLDVWFTECASKLGASHAWQATPSFQFDHVITFMMAHERPLVCFSSDGRAYSQTSANVKLIPSKYTMVAMHYYAYVVTSILDILL